MRQPGSSSDDPPAADSRCHLFGRTGRSPVGAREHRATRRAKSRGRRDLLKAHGLAYTAYPFRDPDTDDEGMSA
jgi:hypothetical protein